jgi:hypothetical protein
MDTWIASAGSLSLPAPFCAHVCVGFSDICYFLENQTIIVFCFSFVEYFSYIKDYLSSIYLSIYLSFSKDL